jgi:hypothetical protein
MNFDVPQAEKYWRERISKEILELIESNSEANAYGVYLYIRDKNDTGFRY